MATISREELLKIATLSALKLSEEEIPVLLKDLTTLIDYTDQLNNVTLGREINPVRNVNIFREDVAHPLRSQEILSQAPEREETYFVVPKIID